jgi:GNAT superfamily N-acetyltransferase
VARFCESSVPQATFNKRKMTVKLFHALLASGHTCYAAWLDGDIVGWDWVWTKGFVCRYTGLRLEWPEDTCYAGELFEDSRYGGKGVGLALLSHSLRAAQEQGYARQVCWVDSKNKKMLSGAIQLFDFEIIGEIRRKGLFPLEWTRLEGLFSRLSVSRWENRGRAGRGGTLVL